MRADPTPPAAADDLLNGDPDALPASCDVLVIGAGPAGSAAAITLARAGIDVVLVDQHAFPRDKVCGDGLIPDAHRALARLGVLDAVMALAQRATHIGCIGPRGGRVDVPGRLAVLPRKQLDLVLCRAAVRAGARMFAPLRFEASIEEDGRVVGARLKRLPAAPAEPASRAQPGQPLAAPPAGDAMHAGEAVHANDALSAGEAVHANDALPAGDALRTLRARWVLLATGAVPQALMASGLCTRHTPSGIALRGYVRNPRMRGRIDKLEIVWHRALSPGYGWVFPCGNDVFNIGVGVAGSHGKGSGDRRAGKELNLRRAFDDFARIHAPARELLHGGEWIGALKGAPLRCTLEGAKYSRPGLIVAGEAAGSTYAFSGEGIGKALETGMLAAEAIVEGGHGVRGGDDALRLRYEAALAALKPRFDLYARANHVNRHPWLADLLIWRARKSERLLRRMSGVLEETSNPGHLVTVKGMLRLFTE